MGRLNACEDRSASCPLAGPVTHFDSLLLLLLLLLLLPLLLLLLLLVLLVLLVFVVVIGGWGAWGGSGCSRPTTNTATARIPPVLHTAWDADLSCVLEVGFRQ